MTEVISVEQTKEWLEKLKAEHPLSAKVIEAMAQSGDSEAQILDWLEWQE